MRLNRLRVGPLGGILSIGVVAFLAMAAEVPRNTQLVITSIRSEGTNVILAASVPPGLGQVILEMRPSLETQWEEKAILEVPSGGGDVAFTLPKPDGMQFFRLKSTPQSATASVLSSELRYVTIPPLGTSPAKLTNTSKPSTTEIPEAVFHFKGTIDGSDKITITRDGALWEHVHWDWPQGAVEVNGAQWNPREKNYLTSAGASKFLPETFSLDSVDLEEIHGRGVVALERAENALIVYIDDIQNGADEYEFKVHFHVSNPKPAKAIASIPATLKITAEIDGSDCFIINSGGATLQHGGRLLPGRVMLNNVSWFPQQDEVIKNEGTNTFLPKSVDFSTAKIVNRKGRDLATMWAEKEALWVRFVDNPNGSDTYEIEISFGK
ncbi:hypothetical protein [Pedosphaera parvula]|uniref:Uncharacterized protein n=1 Tax=Pedosphaera parvula (strain Ellin514) TaxID=320771 RepID=B9XPK5_PEDPL|nr:hypothetical protein [Pedosphaera parvula]EEF58233.1 hypothetical protein Cflav_PD1433 [Pedosphaera parvula Ellin514]